MKRILFNTLLMLVGSAALLSGCVSKDASAKADKIPPTLAEVSAIAKQAYVYGFPIVDNYRVSYAYYTDKSDPNFKALWNQIANIARVFTPDDTAVQTPNSGTPYSWMGMDLRAEPIVLTVPAMEEDRYFSVQNISSYLDNTLTGYYFFTKIKTIEF